MEQKWNENENKNKKWIKEMKTVLRDKIKYQYFINIKKMAKFKLKSNKNVIIRIIEIMITIMIIERKVTWLIFERRNCKAD